MSELKDVIIRSNRSRSVAIATIRYRKRLKLNELAFSMHWNLLFLKQEKVCYNPFYQLFVYSCYYWTRITTQLLLTLRLLNAASASCVTSTELLLDLKSKTLFIKTDRLNIDRVLLPLYKMIWVNYQSIIVKSLYNGHLGETV